MPTDLTASESTSTWSLRSGFDPSTDVALLRMIRNSPEEIISGDHGRDVFKDDKSTTVFRVRINEKDYVVKRFNARSAWHQVKRALRRSRARRCWTMAREFQLAGIRTPRPTGWVERRWGPLRGDSWYICEYVHGMVCMDWLPEQDESTWEAFRQEIEQMFLAMHREGVSHGDMKSSNLIWSDGLLYVIDLDAAEKSRLPFRRRLLQKRDRERFRRNWQIAPELRNWLRSRLNTDY